RRARTGGSPRGLFSGSVSTFEGKRLKGEARADVLLQMAERVVRQLEKASPAALLPAATGQHAPAQLDLPARDRKQGRVLDVAFAAPPCHLTSVQLGRDAQRHIGGGAENLLEAPRPFLVQVDDRLVAGDAQCPARPPSGALGAKATGVRDQRHSPRAHRGLQVQERLQRELVELRRLVGKEPELVDGQRLDAVVLPVIGVAVKWRFRQQGRGKRTSRSRLAKPGL